MAYAGYVCFDAWQLVWAGYKLIMSWFKLVMYWSKAQDLLKLAQDQLRTSLIQLKPAAMLQNLQYLTSICCCFYSTGIPNPSQVTMLGFDVNGSKMLKYKVHLMI